MTITCEICLAIGQDEAGAPGSLVCPRHVDRMWAILNQILTDYLIVSDTEYLVSTVEPSSDYTKSRPPCSLSPITLTDPRTRYTGKGSPVSAERVLRAWAMAVAESTIGSPDSVRAYGVVESVAYLKGTMAWITSQPAVVRFATHIACVAHALADELPKDKEADSEDSQDGAHVA